MVYFLRKYTPCLFIIFYLLFFLFPNCFSQETQNVGTLPLSLEEAILTAFLNNKDIQIQEKEINYAQANIVGARSEFLPTVGINAGYTHQGAVSPVVVPGKKDIGIFTGYKDDNTMGVTVTDSIYNGGASIANYNQAKLGLTTQEETLRAKKLDLEFEAKRLYYGLLLAYETERITQETVDQAKAHYEDVKNKVKEGTATRFDELQSQVQVSLLMPELVKAKNATKIIMADLDKLLGFQIDSTIMPKEKLDYTLIEIKEPEFLKSAYLKNPEMILKSLGIDISKWQIEMAKSGWRLQVNANLGYDFRSGNVGNMFNNRHSNWYAGVTVGLSIFDGFSTKAKVDEAKARYAQAILEKGNVSDQIAVDIRKGCLDLRQAEEIINSQKDDVGKAREALRIAIANYDNGEGINLDVLDAQVSLGQIEKNLAEGIYDYVMARAYLDRTIGNGPLKEAKNEKKN